jgi:beta-phosphoglucomutase-like phosphatase (HAD superfamily)
VITEFDGVLVDSTEAANIQAWLQVAEEMKLPRPLGQVLRRIQGARDEVVIMQLFHWTRNPAQAAKIAKRKEEIYDSIMNGVQPAEVSGSRSFLDTLRNYNWPWQLHSLRGE